MQVLHHSGARKVLNYCCMRRIRDLLKCQVNSPDSITWKLSWCLHVATPLLHDTNFHPTNADNHSLTVLCLLFGFCSIFNPLPFFGLSQNRSPRGSPASMLLWTDISYKGLGGSNKTRNLLTALTTQSKPHCYSCFLPQWDPLPIQQNNKASKMGLKERRNGRGGCLWEKNKGIFSSPAHKRRGTSTP